MNDPTAMNVQAIQIELSSLFKRTKGVGEQSWIERNFGKELCEYDHNTLYTLWNS